MDFLDGKTDIYKYLGVSASALEAEVKKQYRKQALLYHPDKALGDSDRFQKINQAYEILSNPELKKQYDQLRNAKLKHHSRLDEATRRFQEQVKRAEQQHQQKRALLWQQDAERFEREMAQQSEKRRKLAEGDQFRVVSYKDIPVPELVTQFNSNEVKVEWKPRPGVTIDESVVNEIMALFGPVDLVTLVEPKPEDRYHAAIVRFTEQEDAAKALAHDYKGSATLWDGTPVRKTASLLRGCTSYPPGSLAMEIAKRVIAEARR